MRAASCLSASTSGREPAGPLRAPRRARRLQVSGALFEPPPFQPQKLSVQYLATPGGGGGAGAGARALAWRAPPAARRYTLTHNDITGALRLSIGEDYNAEQVRGFYTRLLRDEITAEWLFGPGSSSGGGGGGGSAPPELHIFCHVSGEERWLAPPQLRNFIFRREMSLVLDTFAYADREFLRAFPHLWRAKVYVHFQSDVQDLDLREYWGVLGDRNTWQRMPRGVLARLKLLLFGFPAVPHQRPRTSLTRLQQLQEQQQQQQEEAGAALAAAAEGLGAALQPKPPSQWQLEAELAVAPTRPVALSLLQEQRRLHPEQRDASNALQQQQQQLGPSLQLPPAQQQLVLASLPVTESSSSGGRTGDSSQQTLLQPAAAAATAEQLAAVLQAAGQQQPPSALPQPLPPLQQQQQQELPLVDYGRWRLLRAQKQQPQLQGAPHAAAAAPAGSGGSSAGMLLPLVVLDDASAAAFQQHHHHQLRASCPAVAVAGAPPRGRAAQGY